MRIEELLDKYFEGNTSATEEKELRTFFASGNVPPHLSAYIPLFAYFDGEIATVTGTKPASPVPERRIVLYLLSGVAAAILLILGVRSVYTSYESSHCAENYVVINGRCYTDIHKVRNMALEALKEVAAPDNHPAEEGQPPENGVIEMQLKEFGSLFIEK